jgi:SPP1 family predicted phage head-tail adaptor
MRAGRLDQRVTIERQGTGYDAWGQPLPGVWEPVATVWAAVEPLNGREFFAASAVQSEVSTRIRIRYRPGLSPVDRVNHEGRVHDILTIINPRSANRELVLMCRASAA